MCDTFYAWPISDVTEEEIAATPLTELGPTCFCPNCGSDDVRHQSHIYSECLSCGYEGHYAYFLKPVQEDYQ